VEEGPSSSAGFPPQKSWSGKQKAIVLRLGDYGKVCFSNRLQVNKK